MVAEGAGRKGRRNYHWGWTSIHPIALYSSHISSPLSHQHPLSILKPHPPLSILKPHPLSASNHTHQATPTVSFESHPLLSASSRTHSFQLQITPTPIRFKPHPLQSASNPTYYCQLQATPTAVSFKPHPLLLASSHTHCC